ncbi:MAG: dependent oxidoreductase [Phycisphaerales bacterium]|nr:dependent oxidoreductase [Phycisphaerales bacterium]
MAAVIGPFLVSRMQPEDGLTQSIWSDVRANMPEAPWAGEADVVVIGAGIAGLTTAYLLAGEGKSVTLIDEGPAGRGQTERTSAHLASILDDRFAEVEKQRGADIAKLAYESHAAAIDIIERIAKKEEIACEFARVDAYLFDGPPPTDVKLADEFAAATRCGVQDFAWTDGPGKLKTGRAIRFGNQAIFHPTQYLAGLAKAAADRGVRFRTGLRVIDATGRLDQTPPTITLADQSTFTAGAIVVATNAPTPINDWVSIYLKQAAYRTYMVGLAAKPSAIPNILYWDTHDPYHYARLTKHDGQTVLIVGGEDHKVGQHGASEERFAALTAWAKEIFPGLGDEVVRWSGQVNEPTDGLGVIGVAPTKGEDVYVITGDSGMGLTHGTLGAQLVVDLIAGRENPYTAVYDPKRFLLNNLEAAKENLNTAAQYREYVTAGDISSPDDLKPGDGGLMRQGLKKLAVYKDDEGQVHECSAVCPHLAGIVQWNPVEKTWDCPAHGSRFTCTGKLLMGPSVDDLSVKD